MCGFLCIKEDQENEKNGGRTGHVQVNCSTKSPRTSATKQQTKNINAVVDDGGTIRFKSEICESLVPRKRSIVLKNHQFVVTKEQRKPVVL